MQPLTYGKQPLSLWEATVDVFEAGQQVVMDRIELLRAEISADGQRLAMGVGLILASVGIMMLGWIALNVALIIVLAGPLGAAGGTAVVGAGHFLVGALLAFLGVRRFQRMQYVVPRGAAERAEDHDA